MNQQARRFRFGGVPAWSGVLLAVIPLVAGQVRAEGAMRTLDCRFARICDASGDCAEESGELVFRMEPEDVSADGSGSYRLSYGETAVAMTAMSFAGPFVWTIGDERHALIASSEQEFLWHRLTLATEAESVIRFLVCGFSQ